MIDDQLPAPRVAEMAANGELANLEPFGMPLGTVRYVVRKERTRRRRAQQRAREINADDPAGAAKILRRRVLALAEGVLAEAEAQLEGGRLAATDFSRVSTAALDIARRIEADQLPKPSTQENGDDKEAKPDGFLEQLASNGSGQRQGPIAATNGTEAPNVTGTGAESEAHPTQSTEQEGIATS